MCHPEAVQRDSSRSGAAPTGARRDVPAGPLDAIDERLVALLVEDGRRSVHDLATTAGISRANAYRRLDRLQRDGVIRGFTAIVDPARVGRPLTVLINVSAEQARWEDLSRQLAALDGVEWLAATTGDVDFLALVRLRDVAELRDVVLEQLHALPGVTRTTTVFVLQEQRR